MTSWSSILRWKSAETSISDQHPVDNGRGLVDVENFVAVDFMGYVLRQEGDVKPVRPKPRLTECVISDVRYPCP